jgi:uncharacterized membrane protein YraQ (UPF0718 family)
MADKRIPGGWLFLALVLVAYGATALVEPGLARAAWLDFLSMLGKIAPVLAMIYMLMFLGELLLSPQRVEGWLGRHSGLRGWLVALAVGILSSGPVYAWYALLAELRAKGMRTALLAVILDARAIKLPLLPLLAHYFGLRYMVIVSLLIAVFSILNGWMVERLERPMKSR